MENEEAKEESVMKLAEALSIAQCEFLPIKKTANNPFFKSKYAPLDEIISCTKEGLKNNGLCVVQIPNTESLTTVLMHKSGEKVSCNVPLFIDKKNNSQSYGASVTYARRVSLSAILNVASEDDDDGNRPQTNKLTCAQMRDGLMLNPLIQDEDFIIFLQSSYNMKESIKELSQLDDRQIMWLFNNCDKVVDEYESWKQNPE